MPKKDLVSEEVLQELINKIQEIVNNYCWNLEYFTEDEVQDFFQASSHEITYYNGLINDNIESKNFLWSSKKIAEELAKAIIEANGYTDNMIKNISSIKLSYVTSLPTSDISENTIYILKASDGTSKDTLNLYNATDGWISIGEFDISLDDYYTKNEIDTKMDLKANKTEVVANDKIVQTLDSTTNSSDTVLSTSGLQTEMDKKANDNEVIKKTSLVTSIDSNSTEDTVPSSKSVYDNAVKNKNIKTYTNVSQLGLTTPISVGDLFVGLPDNSLLRISCDNDEITGVPHKNGILIIDKCNSSKFSIEFKISAGGSVNDNTLYIGQLKGVDGTGLTWSKLATESQITELKSKHFAGLVARSNTFDLTQFGYPNTATSLAGIVLYISVYTTSSHGFYLCHFPLADDYCFSYYLGGGADVASFTKKGSKITVTSKVSTSTISSIHGVLLGCN